MLSTRYHPYSLFGQFSNEVNRMLNTGRGSRRTVIEHDWTPAVDIREEAGRFVLVADIPGISRDDVDITLDDGVLTVRGERRLPETGENGEYRRRERLHGTFARQFTLPDSVDAARISATVTDGVLEIVIGKAEQPAPRKITVN